MERLLSRWGAVDKAILAFLALVLLAVLVLLFGFYLPEKGVRFFHETRAFVIGPHCGMMPGGQLDEEIPTEDTCRNLCRANCESFSLSFAGVAMRNQSHCHVCDCSCR